MKKAITLGLVLALAGLSGGCKGNSKGCKIEDQCGRIVEPGANASCTEIKCVPNACDRDHETMLGHQFCDKDGAGAPTK